MGTTVRRLDPHNDHEIGTFYDVYLRAHTQQTDEPYSYRELRALLKEDEYVHRPAVSAFDGQDRVVGAGIVGLNQRDNLDYGFVECYVPPERRRAGHGSAILAALTEIASSCGRPKLYGYAGSDLNDDDPPGLHFAQRHGFAVDTVEAIRRLDLPAVVSAPTTPDGYRLVSWRGMCPQPWHEHYLALRQRIVEQAPSGVADLEDEFWDVARLEMELRQSDDQGRVMQTVAVLSPENELVGHTQLQVPSDLHVAYQWDTLVLPEHRGHGLGLALKQQAMLAAADVLRDKTYIVTWNAASNEPMIAVNEAMGYHHVGWEYGLFKATLA